MHALGKMRVKVTRPLNEIFKGLDFHNLTPSLSTLSDLFENASLALEAESELIGQPCIGCQLQFRLVCESDSDDRR